MTYFILIRHGDTLWTEEKRYQGHTDTSLSREGRKKIRRLAKIFRRGDADLLAFSKPILRKPSIKTFSIQKKGPILVFLNTLRKPVLPSFKFLKRHVLTTSLILEKKRSIIYTSTLRRSKESGEIIAKAMGKKIVEDARINEIGFGSWEGKTAQDLLAENDPVYKKWMKGRWVTAPGGESLQSLRKRVKAFLSYCEKKYKDKTIVVVSHGGTIRMILLELLNLPLKYMFSFRIDPASVSVVKHYTNSAQLVCLNQIFSKVLSKSCHCEEERFSATTKQSFRSSKKIASPKLNINDGSQ